MNRGDLLTLTIERPAAGGRMIARHDGAIVFVSGAIPGEVVEARIEKIQRGTIWAAAGAIQQPSPDRLPAPGGGCGGAVFSHIAYERQRQLKSEIITDAFRRIARLPLDHPVEVVASRIDGYRMRARLHLVRGRLGFFREGSHELCDHAATRQLLPETADALAGIVTHLKGSELSGEVELSENLDASGRVLHFDLKWESDLSRLAPLAERMESLTGATCAVAGDARTSELKGSPFVADEIAGATLSRHVRSFFQGNRFLTPQLVDHVLSQLGDGPVLDLYAGVGLFSVTAAAGGRGPVTAVEGDRYSVADLKRNAAGAVAVKADAVEHYLERTKERFATVVVDPPRTGLSKDAIAGVIRLQPQRAVYVSCDIATLARDARVLIDAGYRIASMRAFDLFPNTAHVETVISFSK